jgi:hypothetical protein
VLDEVIEVGDVVAIALLQQAAATVVGVPHPSGEGDRHALGPGWLAILDAFALQERAA